MKLLAALVLALLVQDDKPMPKIELRGCMKVEGISFRQGQSTKYSGDTFLVKLLFTDDKGNPFQPTPTMNFVVYNGQEPYKKVQRIITKEQWKADVTKINRTPSRTTPSPATKRPASSGSRSSAPTRASIRAST